MSKEVCTIGAKLSHGGTVRQGSSDTFYNGKGIARVGDKAFCAKHRWTKIVSAGQSKLYVNGKLVAVNGAKCACGATLVSIGDKSFFVD